MPRKSKENNELNLEKVVKKSNSTSKDTEKKNTSKKTGVKKSKKETVSSKKTTKSTLNKTITSKREKKTSSVKKSANKVEIIEYYDLPYRYNETIIKLLAQTPKSLFVYWDISDEDRKNFIKKYGENFFEKTKPVLLVHNKTMNYTFEVEINDFANSWYLHVNDADCVYNVELGRKLKNNETFSKPEKNTKSNNYIYVTSSNNLEAPNDHILFNNLEKVFFKNVKTNNTVERNVSDVVNLQKIEKIYNIYDLYKKIYPEENMNILNNPSSAKPKENTYE